MFFRRTAAQKSWLRALEALLCKVFQGIPFHWMRGRVPRSSPPASGHLRTACKGSIDKEGPLPAAAPLCLLAAFEMLPATNRAALESAGPKRGRRRLSPCGPPSPRPSCRLGGGPSGRPPASGAGRPRCGLRPRPLCLWRVFRTQCLHQGPC